MKVIYRVEHLECPVCAGRIEEAVSRLDGVEAASLSLATSQLHVTADSTEGLLERIQAVSDSIEEGVVYLEKSVSGHHHEKAYAHELPSYRCTDPDCECRRKPERELEASKSAVRMVYTVENIDCPNCAAKIEDAIRRLDGVEDASLSYTTGQLHIAVRSAEGLTARLQEAADRVEEGVIFREKTASSPARHEEAEHSDLPVLLVGALLFAAGLVTEWFTPLVYLPAVLQIAAYLVMGWEVLFDAGKCLAKGMFFDENTLMSVATLGALAIGCWEEAAGVMLFFRIGELFEHLAVERSRKSVMQAIDLRPETVQRLTDGTAETIPAGEVRVGDRLLVRVGDRIPVDGRVVSGESVLDTAAMTGESVPVPAAPGTDVMSGCINLSGVLEIEAAAELGDSMVTRVLDSVENAAAGKPQIDRFITRFARIYTPAVVGIAVLTAVIPSLVTGSWGHWIYTALNFLMISCPCALVLSVPLAFFIGIGAGSANGILFKDGITLEALDGVQAVVMDKTGTLTSGSFSVTDIRAVNGTPDELLRLCAACERVSTHPIAKSILACAQERGIAVPEAVQVQELSGKGILGVVDGRQIACGNEKLMPDAALAPAEGTCVHVAADGQYLGSLLLSDTLKPGAKSAVAEMNRRGLHTVMLTGDSPAHAQEVAASLQIAETHAGLLPTEKPDYMQQVRSERGAVLFVGDGINDAPVLSGADVGAAMGSGADAAMEAADMVLLGSDPQSVITALDLASRVNRTAKACIVFALAVKAVIMLLGFLGFANMWLSVFADTGVTIVCVLYVFMRIHHYRKKAA